MNNCNSWSGAMILVRQDGSAEQFVFAMLVLTLFRCLFLVSRRVSHSPLNLKTRTHTSIAAFVRTYRHNSPPNYNLTIKAKSWPNPSNTNLNLTRQNVLTINLNFGSQYVVIVCVCLFWSPSVFFSIIILFVPLVAGSRWAPHTLKVFRLKLELIQNPQSFHTWWAAQIFNDLIFIRETHTHKHSYTHSHTSSHTYTLSCVISVRHHCVIIPTLAAAASSQV